MERKLAEIERETRLQQLFMDDAALRFCMMMHRLQAYLPKQNRQPVCDCQVNMDQEFKGGNSRLLARMLDQFDQPTAILDRQGEVVFVNRSMCAMVEADATVLVGKKCSWQTADDGPLASILTALAPPSSALDGKSVVRRLLAPIVFGANHNGQLFLPLCDDAGTAVLTIVILGQVDRLQGLLLPDLTQTSRSHPDRTLVHIRSRWKSLDGLLALIGNSPAIELAMQRSQLAINNLCNVMICGPGGVGKHELAQGLFVSRLKALAGQQAAIGLGAGQCFPIDCRKLDAELVDSMLEIFVGRLRPDLPKAAQQLILTGLDRLNDAALERVIAWLDQISQLATVVSTSSANHSQLVSRGSRWPQLMSRLSTIEVHIPGLSERREDIAPLALQALSESCRLADRAQLTLSSDALHHLEAYAWPSNLRQLRQAMVEAVKSAVLSSAIQPNHLPVAIRTFAGTAAADLPMSVDPIDLDEVLIELEKVMLRRAIRLSPRNRAQAARLLGISRPRFLRRIVQLGIVDSTPNLIEDDEESLENGT